MSHTNVAQSANQPTESQEAKSDKHEKEFVIFVNTRKKTVNTPTLTFEQIVALSFEPQPVPEGTYWSFTVAYTRGPESNREGTLARW
jgi:hypothetical protein